jgi:hypothetical protein
MMMFNGNGHPDHEREVVRKGGEMQGNIMVTCGKSGSSRRRDLVKKRPAITADPVMGDKTKKGGT